MAQDDAGGAGMSKLKPCPFCGSKWTQVRWIGFTDGKPHAYESGYRGECTDCGAITKAFYDIDEAVQAWNRRAE